MRIDCRRVAWSVALVSVLRFCGACEASPEPPHGQVTPFAVRDSAGVEIVESAAPLWTDATKWTVGPEPEVVIRPDEADFDRIFFKAGNVARLSDGRIVFVSRRTQQLFVYGSTGGFLDIWGEPGEGPQEFRGIEEMFRCRGDTLVVRDIGYFAILAPSGHVDRKIQIPSELGPRGGLRLRGVSQDCGRALTTTQQREMAPTHLGTVSAPRLAVWASLSGPEIDTLGMFQGEERFMQKGYAALFPFNTWPSWATDGSNLYFGVGDEPEIQVLGSGGRIEKLIRWEVDREPIPKSEWQAYEEDRERFLKWDPDAAPMTTPPAVHPHPDWQPIYSAEGAYDGHESGFRFDGEGNLWVRRARREPLLARVSQERPLRPPERWFVFDPSGRWLGEVETPEGVVVKAISGGLVLGVAWDELDVEELRVYRIERPRHE